MDGRHVHLAVLCFILAAVLNQWADGMFLLSILLAYRLLDIYTYRVL